MKKHDVLVIDDQQHWRDEIVKALNTAPKLGNLLGKVEARADAFSVKNELARWWYEKPTEPFRWRVLIADVVMRDPAAPSEGESDAHGGWMLYGELERLLKRAQPDQRRLFPKLVLTSQHSRDTFSKNNLSILLAQGVLDRQGLQWMYYLPKFDLDKIGPRPERDPRSGLPKQFWMNAIIQAIRQVEQDSWLPDLLEGAALELGAGADVQVVKLVLEARDYAREPLLVIWGETGTGKSLYAQVLHERSGCSGDFVKSHLGLLEGSNDSRVFGEGGLLEQTENGTLLLEGVGEDSLAALSQQFRGFLESSRYFPPSSNEDRPYGGRIILTSEQTEKELRPAMGEKLAARCTYLPIPPLRERREDIRRIATQLWMKYPFLPEIPRPDPGKLEPVMDLLMSAQWPENATGLRKCIGRLAEAYAGTGEISPETYLSPLEDEKLDHENPHDLKVLIRQHGSFAAVSRKVGVSRSTVSRSAAEHGIESPATRAKARKKTR